MKPIYTLIASFFMLTSIHAQSPYLNLEWEEVTIDPFVYADIEAQTGPGVKCWRIYASIPENWELQINYGDMFTPLSLNATDGFYQNPLGSPIGGDILPGQLALDPTLAYDSWLTIGPVETIPYLVYVLPGYSIFSNWEAGQNLLLNDMIGSGVFITTEGFNPQNSPDENGRVLLAQVTSTGIIEGCFNFQIRRLNPDGTIAIPVDTELYNNVCFTIDPGPGPCYNDFDGNGRVGVSDLLILLSEFGCTGGCAIDVNGDGNTWLEELFFFLAAYTTNCE
jgi:hypothetical protein